MTGKETENKLSNIDQAIYNFIFMDGKLPGKNQGSNYQPKSVSQKAIEIICENKIRDVKIIKKIINEN